MLSHTSIHKWGPISWVLASKAGSPQIVTGEKNDFGYVPVSEASFYGLEDAWVDVQRPPCDVLGWFSGPLAPPKTCIPYSTSIKNQDFKDFASKTPLGKTFEASWSSWKRLGSLSRSPLGAPLATLTGGPVRQIRFFAP